MHITDTALGGSADKYGFSAYRKDGTLFQQADSGGGQNGTGSPTNQVVIGAGNVTVHPH